MSTPEMRRAQSRKAYLTRHLGPDHPDTIMAGRELAAAKLAAAIRAASAAGLDSLDIAAVVQTGQLPRVAVAS
jgi:hypothetical protein